MYFTNSFKITNAKDAKKIGNKKVTRDIQRVHTTARAHNNKYLFILYPYSHLDHSKNLMGSELNPGISYDFISGRSNQQYFCNPFLYFYFLL